MITNKMNTSLTSLKPVKSKISSINPRKNYTKGGARSEKNLYSEVDKYPLYSVFI